MAMKKIIRDIDEEHECTFPDLHNYDVTLLELFLRHSKNITEFSKNKSLKTQILRKKSCFDQIL